MAEEVKKQTVEKLNVEQACNTFKIIGVFRVVVEKKCKKLIQTEDDWKLTLNKLGINF